MLLPAFLRISPIRWVVMSWPVQSCRVSLIGSVESCAEAGDRKKAVLRAKAPSTDLGMHLRENMSEPPCSLAGTFKAAPSSAAIDQTIAGQCHPRFAGCQRDRVVFFGNLTAM